MIVIDQTWKENSVVACKLYADSKRNGEGNGETLSSLIGGRSNNLPVHTSKAGMIVKILK